MSSSCRALAAGRPERYPRLPQRRRPERQELLALVVARGARVLFFRRPDDSELLAGTWELPWVRAGGKTAAAARFARRYGGSWKLGEALGHVRHSITHRALVVEVRRATLTTDALLTEGPEAAWLKPRELDRVAASSLVGKVLRRAGVSGDEG